MTIPEAPGGIIVAGGNGSSSKALAPISDFIAGIFVLFDTEVYSVSTYVFGLDPEVVKKEEEAVKVEEEKKLEEEAVKVEDEKKYSVYIEAFGYDYFLLKTQKIDTSSTDFWSLLNFTSDSAISAVRIYGTKNFKIDDLSTSTNPVPEPATFILLGSGLAGLAFYRRKRK